MPLTVKELAHLIEGNVEGNEGAELHRFAPADTAQPGDVTFAENDTYLARAEASGATAIIVGLKSRTSTRTLIRVAQVRVAFARTLEFFFPESIPPAGIHPTAVVEGSARIDPTAYIGPHCVVGARTCIGAGTALLGGVHVAEDCVIGADCRLFPNVTLYWGTRLGDRVRLHAGAVIGGDGYGYVLDRGAHRKVPQVGHVLIEDDVEIGSNVTIDRGALGPTRIGCGTKIDNLVQLGHNVTIGRHCLLVSQVGIAGSTQIGDYSTLAGQVGLAGHLKIGQGVTIAAKSGVMDDIPAGEKWFGIPARPIRDTKRQFVALQRLPELLRRVAQLEAKVARMEEGSAGEATP